MTLRFRSTFQSFPSRGHREVAVSGTLCGLGMNAALGQGHLDTAVHICWRYTSMMTLSAALVWSWCLCGRFHTPDHQSAKARGVWNQPRLVAEAAASRSMLIAALTSAFIPLPHRKQKKSA